LTGGAARAGIAGARRAVDLVLEQVQDATWNGVGARDATLLASRWVMCRRTVGRLTVTTILLATALAARAEEQA
jgi:hypothetical protein